MYSTAYHNSNVVTIRTGRRLIAIDDLMLWSITLLAMLPYPQIYTLHIGFYLNAFELIYLFIGMLVVIKVLNTGKVRHYLPFIMFSYVAIIYVFLSSAIYNIPTSNALRQLRIYLPFAIATMLLLTGVKVSTERYLTQLLIASIIGALSALIIHYYFPDIFASNFDHYKDVVAISEAGRLRWINATLIFFTLLYLFFPKEIFKKKKILLFFSLFIGSIALFHTLNRTMVIGIILFTMGYIVSSKNIISTIKRVWKVLLIGSALLSVVILIIAFNPKMNHLVQKRYFGGGAGYEEVYHNAVIVNRLSFYHQYLNSIEKYFPVGQGLGRPFALLLDGRPVFQSDISLISFLLPFGVFGLLVFFNFIYILFKLTSRYKTNYEVRRLILLMIAVSLIISLNIDIYSRGTFVIFITILVLSLQNRKGNCKIVEDIGEKSVG